MGEKMKIEKQDTEDKNIRQEISRRFSQLLEHWMDKGGNTQAKLAKTVGVSPGIISQWRNGKRAWNLVTLSKLAKCLSVDISYFFLADADRRTAEQNILMINDLIKYREKEWVDGDVKEISLNKEGAIKGVVTARKCEHCGHHEIGVITKEGYYHPLKSGMEVELTER
jgi:transcriptional regulator with XRE-family HTH domain